MLLFHVRTDQVNQIGLVVRLSTQAIVHIYHRFLLISPKDDIDTHLPSHGG